MIDADRPTLHIRCGSDIREPLRAAGFTGDFLEYADPVFAGPLPDGPTLVASRAHTIATFLGPYLGLTEAACLATLQEAEQRLSTAHHYERVVLWFEHDCYDQSILARCLSRLAEGPLPARLELICIDRHPDIPRFLGLGQLSPAALAALWPTRQPVTPEQIALAQAIWTALRQSDPLQLQAVAATATPALPIAAPALWRHLRELPGTHDGLSLTQRLILDILAEAPTAIGQVFAALVNGREPQPFMGDIQLLATVEAMARTSTPVLLIEPGEKPFPRRATITATGRRVHAMAVDYLSLHPPPRWVGNVAANGRWRWDEVAACVSSGRSQ
ncbi:MAG TPA: DUF1835 domain-containing protein [Rhodopila sp.]|nr:DUF1835 domain-containing protein [Rhodopila sp.]